MVKNGAVRRQKVGTHLAGRAGKKKRDRGGEFDLKGLKREEVVLSGRDRGWRWKSEKGKLMWGASRMWRTEKKSDRENFRRGTLG